MPNNLKENKRNKLINVGYSLLPLFKQSNFHTLTHGKHNLSHTVSPHGSQTVPPPTHLGQEEDKRVPVQSLADLEEAIPNIMEKSLPEVSHEPPSDTRMTPLT